MQFAPFSGCKSRFFCLFLPIILACSPMDMSASSFCINSSGELIRVLTPFVVTSDLLFGYKRRRSQPIRTFIGFINLKLGQVLQDLELRAPALKSPPPQGPP